MTQRPASAAASPEAEWLRACVKGDKAALRSLYEKLGGRVMAVALRLLASRDEAEEIVQETFTTAWRTAHTFDESRGSASSWITTIARNRALDRLRARRDTQSLGEIVGQLPDGAPMPQDLVSTAQEGQIVRRALDALPDEQRSVMLLTYFHGLSQTEIALHTGQPLGTIKTRVRLAMEKLGTTLRAEVSA